LFLVFSTTYMHELSCTYGREREREWREWSLCYDKIFIKNL